eukprot:19392_1
MPVGTKSGFSTPSMFSWYFDTARPPSKVGASNWTVILLLPGVMIVMVGAPGTFAGRVWLLGFVFNHVSTYFGFCRVIGCLLRIRRRWTVSRCAQLADNETEMAEVGNRYVETICCN